MKITLDLPNEGQATLDAGNAQDLRDHLRFLLIALHAEGYSYVHNLLAIKDDGESTSATGEWYNIRQIWDKKPYSQVLISTQKLLELQSDVNFYREEAEQYKIIRNRLAEEVNELHSKLDMPPKYDMVEV